MRTRRLAARWLIPVEGPPIEGGALLIGHKGRILEVGPEDTVAHPADTLAERFDEAVILPGLINTHTHLELTGFEGRVSEPNFAKWIRRLTELKSARSSTEFVEAARHGLATCFAAGVTTVADTGDSGAAITALAEAGGAGFAYQEVFGPHPAQARESLTGLQTRVDELRPLASERVRIGVSPHAPYTVSGELYRAVADWARKEQLPVAVHVAESPAESELLLRGTGVFAEAWRDRGIPPPPFRGTPIRWLAQHGVLSQHTLCIHAVQVDESDAEQLASSGAAVAHCPQSNRAHGHGDAPLRLLLERGIRVGLGTDSVVSVGRLDLLAEARAARALMPSLGADDLLELATLGGARALGIDASTGSLRPGKWADCTVVRVSSLPGRKPAELVLASGPADVLRTYVGGREVFGAL